jgi:hypothetical protein
MHQTFQLMSVCLYHLKNEELMVSMKAVLSWKKTFDSSVIAILSFNLRTKAKEETVALSSKESGSNDQ